MIRTKAKPRRKTKHDITPTFVGDHLVVDPRV